METQSWNPAGAGLATPCLEKSLRARGCSAYQGRFTSAVTSAHCDTGPLAESAIGATMLAPKAETTLAPTSVAECPADTVACTLNLFWRPRMCKRTHACAPVCERLRQPDAEP